jgi:hypothetical protein
MGPSVGLRAGEPIPYRVGRTRRTAHVLLFTSHEVPVTTHQPPPVGYITAVLRAYCAGRCQNGT